MLRSCPRSWGVSCSGPGTPSPQGNPTCCLVRLREHLESVAGKTFLNDRCDRGGGWGYRRLSLPEILLPLVTSQVLGRLRCLDLPTCCFPSPRLGDRARSRVHRWTSGSPSSSEAWFRGVARSLPWMWSRPGGSKDRPQRPSAPEDHSGSRKGKGAPGIVRSRVAARSPLRSPQEHACMQDVREQEAHLESGGAVSPPRLACCSRLRVLWPAAEEPGLWRCGRAPSSQLRAGAPAALTRPLRAPRPSQPQRRGRSPAQRSVCFSSPTDVSQNIGHMFSGNKLGMSANTLGLRWLFQLPHGRFGREGVSTFHPAMAPSTPIRGGISPWRPSGDPGPQSFLVLAPPLYPSVPGAV